MSPSKPSLAKSEIKDLQLAKLKKQIAYVYENSPFYRKKFDEAGVKPHNINRLKDLELFPWR